MYIVHYTRGRGEERESEELEGKRERGDKK